jgi:hypothetical protein
MKCLAIAMLTLWAWVTPAAAACSGDIVKLGHGFYTGEGLAHESDNFLVPYVVGSVDTLQGAMMFGASQECFLAIKACMANKSNLQLAAMVRKYLSDHPDKWENPGVVIIYDAIFRGCINTGSP